MTSAFGVKRMTAKEHCDRVRFDPTLVEKRLPENGFRLVYPKEAPGDDPALYEKITKKANDMWKKTTGTVTQVRPVFEEEKKKKKPPKKKPKKKKKVKVVDSDRDEEEDEPDESNWQGDQNAEETAVAKHLEQNAAKKPTILPQASVTLVRQPSNEKTDSRQSTAPRREHPTPVRGNSMLTKPPEFCTCREPQSSQQPSRRQSHTQNGHSDAPMIISTCGVKNLATITQNSECPNCHKRRPSQPRLNYLKDKKVPTER